MGWMTLPTTLADYRVRKRWTDAAARVVIRVGGITVILAIIGVAVVLLWESVPLFQRPRLKPLETVFSAPPLLVPETLMTDEYGETLVGFTRDGRWRVWRWPDFQPLAVNSIAPTLPSVIAAYADPWTRQGVVVDGVGQVWLVAPEWRWGFRDTRRYLKDVAVRLLPWTRLPLAPGERITAVSMMGEEPLERSRIALATDQSRLFAITGRARGGLLEEVWEPTVIQVTPLPPGAVQALAITADFLLVGTDRGTVGVYAWTASSPPVYRGAVRFHTPVAPITAMSSLWGRFAIAIGDAAGRVCIAFPTREPDGTWRLTHIRDMEPQRGPIRVIAPAHQTRGFFTVTDGGVLAWHHSTAGTTRGLWNTVSNAARLVLTSDRQRLLVMGSDRRVWIYRFRDPHPEISLRALFGRVWYEGYNEPRFVWQSSGGHEEFEPKFSLVPLLFGTLKGTFYALFFAVPISVLGALYMGYFLHPRIRGALKPLVELMAGLPSVVLGFLAGLWMAPRLERWFPAFLVWPIVFVMGAIAAPLLWRYWPLKPAARPAQEVVRLVLLGVWLLMVSALPFWLNDTLEDLVFAGDYKTWFRTRLGWTYEQRNAMVVGFAMGYAVIPIIFSIAEESVAAVPREWISGALALGATPWQTVRSIVIPASLSGIVSAVMVGFGRAVGETMIVLMATGNTPVMDPSPLTGFRTISANLAVELPEAPVGTTHYRVLFLAALLLFFMTVTINTVAELLRERVRHRYLRG